MSQSGERSNKVFRLFDNYSVRLTIYVLLCSYACLFGTCIIAYKRFKFLKKATKLYNRYLILIVFNIVEKRPQPALQSVERGADSKFLFSYHE